MKRIAFFGPVNPIPSGISDYDEELLPLLRQHYEVDVFAGHEAVGQGVYHHGEFLFRNRQRPYDLPLYQMGNSLLHEYMYGALFQYPGAIVFHDYCLHHSRAKMLFLKAMYEEYCDEVLMAHPETPELGKTVHRGVCGELLLYYFPFVRLLVQSALAAAAHTDAVADLLKIGETPVVKIPMAVAGDSPPPDPEMEERYRGRLVLASFGLVTREKRIEPVLEVLSELRWHYPHITYLIVGEVASYYDLSAQIEHYGLSGMVETTGRVDRRRFHQYLRRADIVINLRYPSAGEMSATLLRALACGKPVLMSRLAHLLEIPAEAAVRIRPDREVEDVHHHLWQLIESESIRRKTGEAALRYIREHHRPEQMMERYRELIELALERKSRFQPPDLPLHLRRGKEIMRNYISKTSFNGQDSSLLNLCTDLIS